MVEGGLAVTVVPVVPLKPVEGLQIYVLAPLAVSVAEPAGQMVVLGAAPIATEGLALMVMVTCAESRSLQPPPITYSLLMYVPGALYNTVGVTLFE